MRTKNSSSVSVVVESLAGQTTSSPRLFRFLATLQRRIDDLDPAVRLQIVAFMHTLAADIVDELVAS